MCWDDPYCNCTSQEGKEEPAESTKHYEVQGLIVRRNEKKQRWMTFEPFSTKRRAQSDCKKKRKNHSHFTWRVVEVKTDRFLKEIY